MPGSSSQAATPSIAKKYKSALMWYTSSLPQNTNRDARNLDHHRLVDARIHPLCFDDRHDISHALSRFGLRTAQLNPVQFGLVLALGDFQPPRGAAKIVVVAHEHLPVPRT